MHHCFKITYVILIGIASLWNILISVKQFNKKIKIIKKNLTKLKDWAMCKTVLKSSKREIHIYVFSAGAWNGGNIVYQPIEDLCFSMSFKAW